MSHFAVTREAGPGWTDGRGTFDQPGVNDHTTYMNRLADVSVVLFAGPLAGTEQARIRALVIMAAPSEAEVHHRLADDPWALDERLLITNVESWNIIVGGDRLPAPADT